MPVYRAPLDDVRFVLDEIVGWERITALPGYGEATPELVSQVLEEGARLAEEVLAPLNAAGDAVGCRFEAGRVYTPPGFKEAYRVYAEGGWAGVAGDPAYGGQGLPRLLDTVLEEFYCGANLSFAIYPGLSRGAYNALALYGDEALKTLVLPRLIEGRWTGTMCLTEPQAGSDLGLIRTRAAPAADGVFTVTGAKIFISAGEHDLADNIVHLVLARLPGAPKGTSGISLFLVPRLWPADGGANGVSCGAIEHKMGIKASATCAINFDEARGWLVGEANQGMRAMFVMMNAARLAVGIQGLGLAEVASRNAVAHARQRRQGRSPAGARQPGEPADPIIVHPHIRRMLMTARALTEGARALGYLVAAHIDVASRHPDAETRRVADDFVQLMTPICKALFTDIAVEVTNLGLQVHGGSGYIRETGVEQFVRDARITQIYEGTNGIQALDLVGRKLAGDMGRRLRAFFHPLAEDLESGGARADDLVAPLAQAFARLQQASLVIARRGLDDPIEAAAAADDYLRLFGLVALGWMWLKMGRAARRRLEAGEGDRAFSAAKLATARFFMAKLLVETSALKSAILAGAEPVMALDADAF